MSDPLVHTVQETAELLRLSRSSIFELIGSGQLPSFKIGGRRLVARADIIDFIDRHREAVR